MEWAGLEFVGASRVYFFNVGRRSVKSVDMLKGVFSLSDRWWHLRPLIGELVGSRWSIVSILH